MVYVAVQAAALCSQGSDVGPQHHADNPRNAFLLPSLATCMAPLSSARNKDVLLSLTSTAVGQQSLDGESSPFFFFSPQAVRNCSPALPYDAVPFHFFLRRKAVLKCAVNKREVMLIVI